MKWQGQKDQQAPHNLLPPGDKRLPDVTKGMGANIHILAGSVALIQLLAGGRRKRKQCVPGEDWEDGSQDVEHESQSGA